VQLKSIFLKTENLIHRVSKAFHSISSAVLFLLMLLMATDVAGRYVFKQAITGSIDLVVLMMVVFIFLSFPNTTYLRNHVRTDVLYELFPERIRAILDVITIGFSALMMLLITWQLGARALKIIQNPPGISTSYFYWPHYPFIILASICCGFMFLELLIWFIQSVNKSIKCERDCVS
jgi:TRAP-type C4-dicarboxylate transport system permease small subunit